MKLRHEGPFGWDESFQRMRRRVGIEDAGVALVSTVLMAYKGFAGSMQRRYLVSV